MFAEYVGLTQRVASKIESLRQHQKETKDDILWRVLGNLQAKAELTDSKQMDFGQGVSLPIGEKLYLYLSKPNSPSQKPDGVAEVMGDGLYLDGARVSPSHGSVIAPAMHAIQERVGHFNSDGKLVSLSAYRQWHVIRDGKLISLEELKDPMKRRRRTSKAGKVDVDALLAELGITPED